MRLANKSHLLFVTTTLLLAAGCSGASPAEENDPGQVVGSTAGPFELFSALQARGAAVEVGEVISQPFFSVDAQTLKVNGVDIQVFEFPDVGKAQLASASVTNDGSSVGATTITWIDTPHFFVKERFIVLYVGNDQATINLLIGVVGAQFAGR